MTKDIRFSWVIRKGFVNVDFASDSYFMTSHPLAWTCVVKLLMICDLHKCG